MTESNSFSNTTPDLLINLKRTILKELVKYIPIRKFLSIVSYSKKYQTLFNINSSSYQILYYLSLQNANILQPKSMSEVMERVLHQINSASLDDIASGLCLYLISLINKLRLKYIPVYLEYPELYIVYQKAANDFKYSFNITVYPTEDSLIEYPKQSEAFLTQYRGFFESVTFMKPHFNPYDNSKTKLEDLLIKIKETISYISFSNYKFTSKEKQLLDIINKCFMNAHVVKCSLSHDSFCIPLLEQITQLDFIKNVISLKSSSSKLYNGSIKTLSQSHCYSNLKLLNLSYNKIGDEGLMHLANAFFPSLDKLNLAYNKINKEGVYHLSKCSLITLKILILEGNNLPGTAKYLFINTNLVNITKLNVNDCNLNDNDFALMNDSKLQCLTKLLINKNKSLGKNCLLFVFNIKSLEYIDISNTSINLHELILQNNYSHGCLYMMVISHNKFISSQILIEIFKQNMFPNIFSLDLFNDNINNEFIQYITNNKPNSLKYINIDLNPLISNEQITKCYSIYKKLIKYK